MQHIQEVIAYLAEFNLMLNTDKCEFYKKWFIFLEFVITITGIEMNLNKIESIKTWSVSKNVKNIQAFLRFANYNWSFIKNYLKKALLLTTVTQKNQIFEWNNEQ